MPDLPRSQRASQQLPAALAVVGEALVTDLQARGEWPEGVESHALQQQLMHLAAMSDFVAQSIQRHPGLLAELLNGPLATARSAEDYAAAVADALAVAGHDDVAAMRALRQLRRREMVRIAWRDLLQIGPSTRETLVELSALADAFVLGALQYSHAQLVERHGEPLDAAGNPQALIALGMGKLGGSELNFSSDIDLIFAFAEAGQTRGQQPDSRKSLDNGQFFSKVAQRTLSLLNDTTSEGFVYRVDMRLRPFGTSGPLVMNFDGLEAYYLTQGREWERYAMIKARPIGGRPADVVQLNALLQSFVYRRYLDYGAIESLRDLKQNMVSEMVRKGGETCVKLGVGGIREVEFIVQSFQLVRGGRDAGLRRRALVPVLYYIGEQGLLDPADVSFLFDAYQYLRTLENRLQMLADQQTHALPVDEVTQQRIAHALGEPDWPTVLKTLNPMRERVHALFRDVFALELPREDLTADGVLLWAADITEEGVLATLTSLDYPRAEAVARRMVDMRGGGFYTRLSAKGQMRLDRLMPLLVEGAQKHPNPTETLDRLLTLIRAIAGRSVYLQVLLDNPGALTLLIKLSSESAVIADFIAHHPIVIDELLSGDILQSPLSREALVAQAAAALSRVDNGDLEAQMDALRHFRHGFTVRVAVADVLGVLPVKQVSDQLSWLAEAVLAVASDCVWQPLVDRHGAPSCTVNAEHHRPGIVIVAYGKLGGLELGYGSDLDLVFLHDSSGERQQTDGAHPLDNRQFFSRYVQKLTSFLSTTTAAGILYETDTRLRPNGQSGMLVSTLTAFEDYQRDEAWTWEHQALTRARAVVGDTALVSSFARVRERVLREVSGRPDIQLAVREMRERMRRELSRGDADHFDLKQGVGGIADIEFMVQYGVLLTAQDAPAVLVVTDNVQQLEHLRESGVITQEMANTLTDAYLYFREVAHRLSLQGARATVPWDTELRSHQTRVVAIWTHLMNPSA